MVHRTIRTPGLREGVLAGVMRDLAIRASRELGYAVHEGRLRVDRLVRAQEAFVTSSLGGVRPLVRLDGRAIGRGVPGGVTRAIQEAVARMRQRSVE